MEMKSLNLSPPLKTKSETKSCFVKGKTVITFIYGGFMWTNFHSGGSQTSGSHRPRAVCEFIFEHFQVGLGERNKLYTSNKYTVIVNLKCIFLIDLFSVRKET